MYDLSQPMERELRGGNAEGYELFEVRRLGSIWKKDLMSDFWRNRRTSEAYGGKINKGRVSCLGLESFTHKATRRPVA